MKFLVYAPSYNQNSGGCVVLHKLVHIINETTEHEAVLVPRRFEIWHLGGIRRTLGNIKRYVKACFEKVNYKTNPSFNTPVAKSISKKELENCICVYPEVHYGNPLKARNVVRWFLHQPGHFTKEVYFGVGELYFKFNSAIKDFELHRSKLSKNELKVIHYPLDIYHENDTPSERTGTCYLVRKGKDKTWVHDSQAICIDGMSHEDIAKVFSRTKRFISYDDYTAYSLFAILSGCESIVIPSDNIDVNDWYPNEMDRYGISYGLSHEQLKWAKRTRHLVLEHVNNEHAKSEENVVIFTKECKSYFNM
jgi:hypothetical protein